MTYDTTVPKKYKSLELKNETKYNKKKYNEKILVIVLNKGSEVSKLIEFAK